MGNVPCGRATMAFESNDIDDNKTEGNGDDEEERYEKKICYTKNMLLSLRNDSFAFPTIESKNGLSCAPPNVFSMIHTSKTAIVNKETCERWINACELAPWCTKRHHSHPTVDKPYNTISDAMTSEIETLVENIIIPLAESLFNTALSLHELFFVKYEVETTKESTMKCQQSLGMHRDISIVSFNIVLSDASDYEGGGTYFGTSGHVLRLGQGQLIVHSGKLLHAGRVISSGKRLLLVGFCRHARGLKRIHSRHRESDLHYITELGRLVEEEEKVFRSN